MFPAPSNPTGIGVPGRERTEGLILSTHFANFHTSIFSFFSSLPLQQKTRHLPTILLPSLSFRRFFRNERRRSCKKSIVSRWLNNLSRSASQIFYPSILFFLLSWLPFTLVDFFLLLPVTESSSATSFLSLSLLQFILLHCIIFFYFLSFSFTPENQ